MRREDLVLVNCSRMVLAIRVANESPQDQANQVARCVNSDEASNHCRYGHRKQGRGAVYSREAKFNYGSRVEKDTLEPSRMNEL